MESGKKITGFTPLDKLYLTGFTLLELIIVVTIIGILAGISVSNLDYMFPKYRLRAAVREVADHARYARFKSSTFSKDVYVQYDIKKGEYWLLVPVEKKEGEQTKVVYEEALRKTLPKDVNFKNVIISKNLYYEIDTATIRISPFGFSASHIVNLKNKEGKVASFKFNGFTGSVSFYEYEKSAEEVLQDVGY